MKAAGWIFLWAVIGILLDSAATSDYNRPSRKETRAFAVRKLVDTPQQCQNTLQGRWYVTDDTGNICTRNAVDPLTGCCSSGEKFSCSTCNSENKCCEEYEFCVSCCLTPEYGAASKFLTTYKSADRPETGQWSNAFEYCQGKCRTTSKSTVHENAYLAPHHHCFSDSGKPTTPSAPMPKLPDAMKVLPSAKGQSCTAACAEAGGMHCSLEHLSAINNCNLLREHFACEAGCDVSQGPDQPAYVVSSAPKVQRPTICLTNDAAMGTVFNCDGVHENTRRVCPCLPPGR